MKITHTLILSSDGDGYSTRIVNGPDWTQTELDNLVATENGVTPTLAAAIGKRYFTAIMESATPRKINSLFGLMGVKVTCGGKSATPDGFHTAAELKAKIVATFHAPVMRDWNEANTIEQTGTEGVAAPQFTSITNVLSGLLNSYTAAQNVHILGTGLDFDPANMGHGVYMQPAGGGAWVRLGTYGPVTDKNIYVLIPTGTTGDIRLKVINRGNHASVYAEVLAA